MSCLSLFWLWESIQPFFAYRSRLAHAGSNLLLAILNTIVLSLLFGAVNVFLVTWTSQQHFGLLQPLNDSPWIRLAGAVLLLDAWMYLWHRANHRFPLLWRFHRMHHSDNAMDVTTAIRFHLGEHIGASVLRLGLIPLFGLTLLEVVTYESLVIAATMFHHANISIGRWDAWLRVFIVTPFMHKVHHSRRQPETDSNYSTVFSFWDRLAQSFRMRKDCDAIELGLTGYDDPSWQQLGGMLKTPFVTAPVSAKENES